MNPETQIIAEPGAQELFIIREFDAPRKNVFKAFSDPDILCQFYAPFDLTLVFNSQDYRSGGHYNWSCKRGDKIVCTFSGVIHELTTPLRIIQTGEYMDLPERGNVVLEILTFDELSDNRTKLTMHQICPTTTVRDAIVKSGMDSGVRDMFIKLDRLLPTL
ncbi:MAG TPA: SRPBCC domain-containing protein [Mucilaginibacter sp.]